MAKISVILPTLNEGDNLTALHTRLAAAADSMPGHQFDFIFVDDCSTDDTTNILAKLGSDDPRVQVIRLARNCGSHAAVAAGLAHCRSDAAIMLASDLQDPPELMPLLTEQWERGFKTVWGVREGREAESLFVRLCSRLYYALMNRLTDVRQPPAGADVFMVDRAVMDAFNQAPEKNTSVYMLIAWLGFRQTHISYVKQARYSGVSKWTLSKQIKLLFDSLISFSYAPLRLMSFAGALCALLGLLYGLLTVIRAAGGRVPIEGWASLMIVVLVLGGFQLAMLGVLGEYLWRAYDETRGRPRYVIETNTLTDPARLDPGKTPAAGTDRA